jgi:hypothetical protein
VQDFQNFKEWTLAVDQVNEKSHLKQLKLLQRQYSQGVLYDERGGIVDKLINQLNKKWSLEDAE